LSFKYLPQEIAKWGYLTKKYFLSKKRRINMKRKKVLVLGFALAATFGLSLGHTTITQASDAKGSTGQGTGTITITEPTDPEELLSFAKVPDFDFGSHSITGSFTRLTSDNPVLSNLMVRDFRGLSDDQSTYHVTASILDGANGFKGENGGTLTTANVAVTLGDSADGTLHGIATSDITYTNTIAEGEAARGLQETNGGRASLDITNISGIGAVTVDTYNGTVDYTLVAGL
jgi:hypothetical protein